MVAGGDDPLLAQDTGSPPWDSVEWILTILLDVYHVPLLLFLIRLLGFFRGEFSLPNMCSPGEAISTGILPSSGQLNSPSCTLS